jgi:hypothetical protein
LGWWGWLGGAVEKDNSAVMAAPSLRPFDAAQSPAHRAKRRDEWGTRFVAGFDLWATRRIFAAAKMAHRSDDETVAKMGTRLVNESPPKVGDYIKRVSDQKCERF